MKTVEHFLFADTLATAAMTQSHQSSSLITGEDHVPFGRNFSCPLGTVFNQIPVVFNQQYTGQLSPSGTYIVATGFTASSPFTAFGFLGGDFYGCTLNKPKNLK